MLSHRNVSILSIAILASVLLLYFQNCAPAKPLETANSTDPKARLIDDFNKTEIQFAGPEVQISDESVNADIPGLCNRSHNGAVLKWSLWSGSGDVVAQGTSGCSAGGFDIKLSPVDQISCGVTFQLVIEGEWGGSAFTSFIRRCQPVARQVLPADSGVPPGTVCELDYLPAASEGVSCTQACFRGGLLVSQTSVASEKCSGMAAELAGP
jgi:hypothetical protein